VLVAHQARQKPVANLQGMRSMSEAKDTSPGSSRPQRAAVLELSALRQIRESAQALREEGKVEEAFEFFLSALEAVLRKTRELERLVAKLRREGVGKRSERIDPGQLQLLFEALCSQTGEADPTAAIDAGAEAREDAALDQEIREAEQTRNPEKSPGKGQGHRLRTGSLEQVHHHEVPEVERRRSPCGVGVAKERIGEDVTRTLEDVPGHFIEHEHHRAKYACRKCEEGVTTAPGPEKIIERSPAEASVLAHVVVSKIVDHCPLHRLHRIHERGGVDIPVSSLSEGMGKVADLCQPWVDRLTEKTLAAYLNQTDAAGVQVLDPESPENIERGTMGC
jgi:transposase